MNIRITTIVAVCCGALAGSVFATETGIRSYPLPDHGAIQLRVPKSWQDETRQTPDRMPPTIVFSSKGGIPFQVLITPFYSVRPSMEMPKLAEVRSSVENAALRAKSQSVEKSITVKELKGSGGHGYYFSATDKAPQAGAFKHMTQGMLRVGDLAPTFTVLTNKGGEGIVADVLAMLRSATHMTGSDTSKEKKP